MNPETSAGRVAGMVLGLSMVIIGIIATVATEGCAGGYGHAVYNRHGVRLELEAVPYQGLPPLATVVLARVVVPAPAVETVPPCFQVHLNYSDGDEESLTAGCGGGITLSRASTTDGRIIYTFQATHTYFQQGNYGIYVVIRVPHGDDWLLLVKGTVNVQVL